MNDPAVAVPKAELHVHLEGTMRPALVRKLAARNRITLRDGLFDAGDRFVWTDFLDFLAVYDEVSAVVRAPEDYRDITFDYLVQCAAEGTIYVEPTASPDHARETGLSYTDMIDGIARGIGDARAATGIEARILVTCVRHFGLERCVDVAKLAARHPHPLVTGFNMAGAELGHPPGAYARAFAIAAEEAGLGCTVHAGEWGGPDLIREALTLPVTRLGHGVRAVGDPGLLRELAARGITLEVCPTSNVAIGIYPNLAEHPLPHLLAAGVRCTINSDDPPYFETTIGGEYAVAASRMGLSEVRLRGLTRTAIEAAFVDEETRARLMNRLGGCSST